VYAVDITKLMMGVYVGIVLATFWEGGAVWMYSCAVLQIMAASYYVNIVYSPTLAAVLLQFQWGVFLSFIPNPLAPSIGNATFVRSLPDKVYESVGDNLFARSGGYLLTVLIVVSTVTLVTILLKWEKICLKPLKYVAANFYRRYIKFRILNDTLLMFMLPTVFYGCLQFHYISITNFAAGFGMALDVCLLLLCLVWPIYLTYRMWLFTNSQFTLQYVME
jgi:hypothetical protein